MNMSKELRRELLPKLQDRYRQRNRGGKSRMLDELCEDYKYERKYAIKLLGGTLPMASGRAHPGPEPQYELIEPLCGILADRPAALRQTSGAHIAAVAALL